jgi:hypothetical protein
VVHHHERLDLADRRRAGHAAGRRLRERAHGGSRIVRGQRPPAARDGFVERTREVSARIERERDARNIRRRVARAAQGQRDEGREEAERAERPRPSALDDLGRGEDRGQPRTAVSRREEARPATS